MRFSSVLDSCSDVHLPARTLRLTATAAGRLSGIARLIPLALVRCGGWMINPSVAIDGGIRFVFEFEASACMEIYIVLIGLGLCFTRDSHVLLTQSWQVARRVASPHGMEVVTMELQLFDECAERDIRELAA